MGVFVVYMLAAFSLGFALLYAQKPSRRGRKVYVAGMGIALFAIAGLRHETVGTDLASYISTFSTIAPQSFSDILAIQKDKGFYVFVKLLSFINANPRFYMVVIAAIFTVSICYFIYRYSSEPVFSFFALLPLGFFYFSMTGLRQTMAMSVLLFAYPYIAKRKPVQFLLLVILAAAFHKTALVFSLAYLTSFYRINAKSAIVIGTLVAASFVFRHQLVEVITSLAPEDRRYGITDTGAGFTTFIMYLGILAFGLFFRKSVQRRFADAHIMYNMLVLGIIFQGMTPVVDVFFRLSMYFNVINLVFIPNIALSIRDKDTRIAAYIIAVLLLSILYFVYTFDGAGVYPYRFLWDGE